MYYKEKGFNGFWIKYNDKFICGISLKIEGFKDNIIYEVRMIVINYLGISGMFKIYIGIIESMDVLIIFNYRLINIFKENGGFGILINYIVDVIYLVGYDKSEYSDKNLFDKFNVVDGDFIIYWIFLIYNVVEGMNRGLIIIFDKFYIMDIFMVIFCFDVFDKIINDFEV